MKSTPFALEPTLGLRVGRSLDAYRGAGQDVRSVKVKVGSFCLQALRGTPEPESSSISARAAQAIRYYLKRKSMSESPSWAYPLFLDGSESEHLAIEVEVEVEDGVWRAFSDEAERLGVSPSRLAQHAILCLAADCDRGRTSPLAEAR